MIKTSSFCIASFNTVSDINIRGTFTEFENGGNSAGVHSYKMSNAEIHNNLIFNTYNGIYHKESAGIKGADIYSNVIHDVTLGIKYGVKGNGSSPHIDQTVSNNLIYNAAKGIHGWAFDASGYNEGLSIINNTIDVTTTGISLEAYKRVDILNNIFYKLDRYAISMGATNPNKPTLIEYSNYNCYYETNRFGHYPNRDNVFYTSVKDWTEATDLDAQSTITAEDPFINLANYTLKSEHPCTTAGIESNGDKSAPTGANLKGELIGASFLSRRLIKTDLK